MKKEIFVSYSREDRSGAERLAQALQPRGWSVWWDRYIPAGRRFDVAIAERLTTAGCVVVLWSKVSIQSEWVVEEAETARERGVLVPVLLEPVDPPLGFRRIQAANLIGWDGNVDAPAFAQLVDDIDAVLLRRLEAAVPDEVMALATTLTAGPVALAPELAATITGPAAMWDAPTIEGIAQRLSNLIGPMAHVLLARAMQEATDLPNLLAALGRHVPWESERVHGVRQGAVVHPPALVPPCAIGTIRPPLSAVVDQQPLADSSLNEIENALARHIGPVAKLVLNRAIAQSATTEDLCATLLAHIDREDDRRQFRSAVAHLL